MRPRLRSIHLHTDDLIRARDNSLYHCLSASTTPGTPSNSAHSTPPARSCATETSPVLLPLILAA
jgi:hypothetical protein